MSLNHHHATQASRKNGFGLYIHWPFCSSKCPYCDFNSYVTTSYDVEEWRSAYLSEIIRVGEITKDAILDTVYFGGGTPSLMPPDLVHDILDTARKTWRQSNDIEITLEANPSSVETRRLTAFKIAGVNRVSIGAQAFSDPALKLLGRIHSAAEAKTAIETAQKVFDRVSFDLIYARQHQTICDWKRELTQALAIGVDHMSLYQLTIETGTAFGERNAMGGLRGLPGEDLASDMYEVTQSLCEASGLPAYEVSNHAKPGNESRHNLIYWKSGDYAGVGPGAHGRLTVKGRRFMTEAHPLPKDWLYAVKNTGTGESLTEEITTDDQAVELVLTGLRTNDGVDRHRLQELSPEMAFSTALDRLEETGHLVLTRETIKTTRQGRMLLNKVIEAILLQ